MMLLLGMGAAYYFLGLSMIFSDNLFIGLAAHNAFSLKLFYKKCQNHYESIISAMTVFICPIK